jgi:hypothetical protein
MNECSKPAAEPDDKRNSGALSPDEKAAGVTAYNNCLARNTSSSMPGSAFTYDSHFWVSFRQQWRDRCDQAERDAVVQFRNQAQANAQAQAQANSAEFQHTRAVEKAKSRGYELIPSVKDLILDGKELAARNAKIQVTGIYKKAGETNGVLYGSPMDVYANSDNYIGVLTEDAARPVREALMNYSCENYGCTIEVGGHMTMCHHLNVLAKDYPDVPCLNIEVMIVYRAGD